MFPRCDRAFHRLPGKPIPKGHALIVVQIYNFSSLRCDWLTVAISVNSRDSSESRPAIVDGVHGITSLTEMSLNPDFWHS